MLFSADGMSARVEIVRTWLDKAASKPKCWSESGLNRFGDDYLLESTTEPVLVQGGETKASLGEMEELLVRAAG